MKTSREGREHQQAGDLKYKNAKVICFFLPAGALCKAIHTSQVSWHSFCVSKAGKQKLRNQGKLDLRGCNFNFMH